MLFQVRNVVLEVAQSEGERKQGPCVRCLEGVEEKVVDLKIVRGGRNKDMRSSGTSLYILALEEKESMSRARWDGGGISSSWLLEFDVYDTISVEDSLHASVQVVAKRDYVIIMLPSPIGAVGDHDDGKNVLFVFGSVNVFSPNHDLGDKTYEALPGLLANGDINV